MTRANWTGDDGPSGDDVAVDHRPSLDVVLRAGVTRAGDVTRVGSGVVALVEEAGTGQGVDSPADRRHRNPGIDRASGRLDERQAGLGVPRIASGQDQQVALAGVVGLEAQVRDDAHPAHRRDRVGTDTDRHDVEGFPGEASGAELDEEVTDLPVSERVQQGEVGGSGHGATRPHDRGGSHPAVWRRPDTYPRPWIATRVAEPLRCRWGVTRRTVPGCGGGRGWGAGRIW